MGRARGLKGRRFQSFQILIHEFIGKRALGKLRRRREEIFRIDNKEIGTITRNWIESSQDSDFWRALINAHFYFNIPLVRHYLNSIFRILKSFIQRHFNCGFRTSSFDLFCQAKISRLSFPIGCFVTVPTNLPDNPIVLNYEF